MKWIVVAGFTGWGGIVALAWWLADRRTWPSCRYDGRCDPALIADRDAVLTGGLTVALIAALLIALAVVRSKRLNRPTNPVQHPQRLR